LFQFSGDPGVGYGPGLNMSTGGAGGLIAHGGITNLSIS